MLAQRSLTKPNIRPQSSWYDCLHKHLFQGI